jgi:hypothetical protein
MMLACCSHEKMRERVQECRHHLLLAWEEKAEGARVLAGTFASGGR